MLSRGKHTFTAWCRDGGDTWEHELRDGRVQEIIRDAEIDLSHVGVDLDGARQVLAYDPWSNHWYEAMTDTVNGNRIILPTFSRSIVVRVTY